MSSENQGNNSNALRARFDGLTTSSLDEQTAFFTKSFVFALGDNWREVSDVAARFGRYLGDCNEKRDLSHIQAADFLQKNGRTRTALQRKQELLDIDLNLDNRISLTEYLLLHYKDLVLTEYFKRTKEIPNVDLGNFGIGVTGVGEKMLQELFTFPQGLDPEIEAAIEAFLKEKKIKEAKIRQLEDKAAKGGVLGLAAKNELAQIGARDVTHENRVEISLKAAQRRSSGGISAEETLKLKKAEEEKVLVQKRRASREALAMRAAQFEKPKA
jgi:hypothetical protein